MKEKTQRPTLVEACESENRRLKDDPNMLCVGFGLRRRGGKPEYEICLVYHVFKKHKKIEDIKSCGSKPIPKKVHGYPTDVVEVRDTRPAQGSCPDDPGMPTGDRGSRKENPLVGGTSTTVLSDWHSFPTGYGTLGGLCFDNDTGEVLALSNAHVWGMETGKDVIQPWIPTEEYLEAAVKLLTCGPVISYILDTVIPSPLTVGLAAAATAAWIAAAASDLEDPSRWGQRVSPVPPQGARTEAERIHLEAELPNRPFAGRPYSAKTEWKYTRETSQGSFDQHVTKKRKNEHILKGKRVWTERDTYHGGERVRICAEVISETAAVSEDYFVVAHCFPKSNPERIVQRIMRPGECRYTKTEKICFHGFPQQFKPDSTALFPFKVDVFNFESHNTGLFTGPWPTDDPSGVTILRLPISGVKVTFPESNQVTVEVFHTGMPVIAETYNEKDQLVSTATSTEEERVLETLSMQGSNIKSIVLSGGGGEGFLVGICIDRIKEYDKKNGLVYTADLDLDVREPPDKWGIALFVQTVNNVPLGTDPEKSAKVIGGITVSDNIVGRAAGCVTVMLLDHVFDVI